MKKTLAFLTSLALAAALMCPMASAAPGSSLLWLQDNSGSGQAQLTLQNLGSQQVNSVQLELTLGSVPNACFSGGSGGG